MDQRWTKYERQHNRNASNGDRLLKKELSYTRVSLQMAEKLFGHQPTSSVVIRNPKAIYGGTAFVAENGVNYFINELH